MRTRSEQDPASSAAFGLAGGCAVVIAAALAAAAMFAPAELGARLLVVAAAAGVLARFLIDWRACAGVTVFAALVFVGFLAHQAGDLTGDLTPWPYTIAIGLAAVLGRGQRWFHALNAHQAGRATQS